MFKKMLLMSVTALVAALAASAASATPPKPPGQSHSNSAPTKVAHHGLSVRIKLNASVSDGQDAQFSLTITKQAGRQTAPYLATAVGWSFDGAEPANWAALKDLTSPGGDVRFMDPSRNWVRIGNLNAGQGFHMDGKVAVPDRSKSGARQMEFFCVRAYVYSALPGHPNAGWTEQSNMSCAQYSVQ